MKVLVVDDDLEQLSIRTMLLEKSGFEVVKASDAKLARELAAEHRPNCVLMDLNLPTYADGLTLIHDLKAMDGNMRLLILTGSDPRRFRQHPEAKMVDGVFGKPASIAALMRKLKAYA
jgi:DNA-binding response OmpR family regulator